ncbi:MAG TPA: carboxypeptidase regulatory-like domain-containing protein [Thermoanaerobaculia bacterium]|nr:carboxypeptidase regulatory-like domain-containing protein [Thermoanaerobaculia bacterium]
MKRVPPSWSGAMQVAIRAVCMALLVSLVSASAFAQISTGNIFGKVAQDDGSAVPGVTVTLSGVGAPQTTVTDAQGEFRFVGLTPGSYTVKADLAGFGMATRTGVTVNIGRNTVVDLPLNPSMSAAITVTGEAPLLDVRKTGTGATVTKMELEEIPTARDPWVILQQVPGVLTDRMNIGGSESGQQSSFIGKGASGNQATFNVDGVNITDMTAVGSSPGYYDFDAFEEIQVATGGTDPRIQTPGVQLNMVTKRGTNDITGSGRYMLVNGDWQEDPVPDAEGAHYLRVGNEIDNITDTGIEIGGPIIKDKLWMWGAYSNQQIDLFVAQNVAALIPEGADPDLRYSDKTELETLNAKINAQPWSNNSAVATYWDSGKVKFGRNASPTRPPDTTYNQDNYGPTGSWKIEDTHTFASSFYLTGMYSRVNGGFQLVPNGGKNCTDFECIQTTPTAVLDYETGIWSRNFYYAFIERPQDNMRADASAFFDTGSLNHELKFGVGYREVQQQTQSGWPTLQYVGQDDTGYGGVGFFRPANSDVTGEYTDLYVGDTVLFGNLTLQAGLRYDLQKGTTGTMSVGANPDLPELLPAVTFSTDDELEFESISPRIGLTYALGQNKKTLIRAGYNRYVDQMSTGTVSLANPLALYQYLYFYGVEDANLDGHITKAELINSPDAYLYQAYGLSYANLHDLNSALTTEQLYRFDDDLKPPSTDELILGFEHEILSDFTVGLTYTHRALNDFLWNRPEKTKGAGDWYTSADYTLLGNATGVLPPCDQFSGPEDTAGDCSGGTFSVPVYHLKPGVNVPIYYVVGNRPGYSQTYDGLEATFVKRLSNRWMMRGNISWNDWTQNVDDEAIIDPTPLRATYGCSVCDGAQVVQGSGTGSGSKGGVYINSRWSYNLTGLYQLPLGFNIGASLTAREGYPVPYVSRVATGGNAAGGEGFKQVLIAGVDDYRLDDVFNLDLRISKDFRFANRVGLTVGIDAFNVTDERTVLQRNTRIYRSTSRRNDPGDRIAEYQSPRVFRVGARLTF